MPAKLNFVCCANFHTEVAAAIAAEDWEDVASMAFPARCGRPPLRWEELQSLSGNDCAQAVLLGRACLAGLTSPPAGFPPTRSVPLEQCFHLLAGSQLVAEALAAGGYLVTPSWLADWRGRLRDMGFAPEQAGEFFQDFAKELVFLDSGVDPAATTHFAAFCQAVGLPGRRIAVGLDHVRPLLARQVLEWRLAQQEHAARTRDRQHARELADHVSAMDLLSRLSRTQSESEAIAAIEDLFRMLFAPRAMHYVRMESGLAIPLAEVPSELLEPLKALAEEYAWTPDGQGFLLSISHGNQVMGKIAIDRLAFPEYRERYLNMALAMIAVCGLAIENARNRKKLVEAAKMASLGILVAGVAHEINTPLGVSLAASSSLQQQSEQLAQRFSEHSMTQSDLESHLHRTEQGMSLIRGNLERIGHLVDSFRQVAVDGQAQETSRFRLRVCLEETLRSLSEQLSGARVAVHIECDPTLEIESLPGDWVSIFTNLVSNSLKHGFKDRERGNIEICVGIDGNGLRIVYRDDGKGMQAEALARVFDPFFTTDLQHGMGLGMHLVYNLITQRFGGAIHCQSQPGQGVKFHIEVPL